MATRGVYNPGSAEFPSSAFPQYQLVNRRPVLSFDATTQEGCYWTDVAAQGLTGTLTLVIKYMMASATSGGIRFQASIEAVTTGDATDLDAGTSFDTANGASDTGVPGTAGYTEDLSITLTNNDSIAAGDYFRIFLERVPGHADDTATGDCHVLSVELRDGA